MIRVPRPDDSRPDSLDKTYSDRVKPPKIKRKTELQAVLERMKEHRKKVSAKKAKLVDFTYPYERYSDSAVVTTLADMFHGKCAYCESRYAGTQPMDVEHWRPKGEVKENVGTSEAELGYYWLASEWTNLLPSCIDCNRARTQFDELDRVEVLLGKKNQFPVEGARTSKHEDDPEFNGGSETNLLINPCEEDPEALLKYDEEQGLILPRSEDPNSLDHKRAQASIRVYALNRAELVTDRMAIIDMVDHRLRMIDLLTDIGAKISASEPRAAEGIADVIAAEIDVLFEMAEPQRPYAGLMRQLVRDLRPA